MLTLLSLSLSLLLSALPQNPQISLPNDPNNPSTSIVKLRKIPPIPIRQTRDTAENSSECRDDDDDYNGEDEEEDPIIVEASSLGLTHIRTRSDPSRLRFSSSSSSQKPSNLGNTDLPSNKPKDANKLPIPLQHAFSLEPVMVIVECAEVGSVTLDKATMNTDELCCL